MQTLEVTHGQNKRNNVGAKTSQHTNHGNVLRKEKSATVIKDGLSMELKLVLIRKNLTSLEPSSSLWLFLVLTVRDHSNVMPHHSMVLIQLQMLTKLASVIKRRNSLTNHSFQPQKLSGSHLKLNPKLKVSLREQPNTQLKF
jgi:hypothetical protein